MSIYYCIFTTEIKKLTLNAEFRDVARVYIYANSSRKDVV